MGRVKMENGLQMTKLEKMSLTLQDAQNNGAP